MGLIDLLTGNKKKTKVQDAMSKGAVIIDVRSPEEFRAGHVAQSKNIPLDNINGKAKKIKQLNKPVITCCRSGMRSGMAAQQLRKKGIEVINGGPWHKVDKWV